MQKVIRSMLAGKTENHILPFFWQHGESEAILRETVAKIHQAHIGAVCVESRPHPDFLGESWWRDMDVIMDECKKRWCLSPVLREIPHRLCRRAGGAGLPGAPQVVPQGNPH